VGRFEFQSALYPVRIALCLAAAQLPQHIPALTRTVPERPCWVIEPEGQDDRRDYTGERAVRLASINSTGRAVFPGTGALVVNGFAPTVTTSG